MKFNIHKEALFNVLQKIQYPSTIKQNFPILSSVFISTFENKLKFITTDLDTTIITYHEADIKESGRLVVPMKRFISIVREFPSSEIFVELHKNNMLIRCEKIEFKINTLNAEEFPRVEEDKKVSLIKINAHDLSEMIKLTSFCAGVDDQNLALNGILFEMQENKITLAASDGKRLSFAQRTLPETQPEIKTKIDFILPVRAVIELAKLIGDYNEEILMYVDANRAGFNFKNTEFVARMIEREFPMYRQYVPEETKNKLIIDRIQLLSSLRRADLLSVTGYLSVLLELKKDLVVISKNTPQLGEIKESVPAQYSGPAIQIGFNPAYIMDILKILDDTSIQWEFFPNKPAVLRKEEYTYLVLPVKT